LIAKGNADSLQTHLTHLEATRQQWLTSRTMTAMNEPSLLDEVEDRNFLRQLFTFKRKPR
jgi:hypothetical protein